MFVLPVSRARVALRGPTGREDMLFAESHGTDPRVRVDIVRLLAPPADGSSVWDSLPFVDVDAALLALRQFVIGDRLVAEIQCRGCEAWGDVEISIAKYLASKSPRLPCDSLSARIPTVQQVLEAIDEHGSEELAAHAIEAESLRGSSGKEARRIGVALERAAPPMGGPITGMCPHCEADVTVWFDPGAFFIGELRQRWGMLLEEVHLLASHYRWTEGEILALPARRRAVYAELIAEELAT
jgi:hypothetical protein